MNETKEVEQSDVADVIGFNAAENPPWRRRDKPDPEKQVYPTVEGMIADIAQYQNEARKLDEKVSKSIEKKFLHKYIFHVNSEGKRGVDTEEETRECIETVESTRPGKTCSIKEKETINVFQAYQQLEEILEKEGVQKSDKLYGLLDIDILKDLHKTILKDISSQRLTEPGKCSDMPRCCKYKGEQYDYRNPDNMDHALTVLLDRYNNLSDWIKYEEHQASRIYKIFKTSSWLLFEFLDLHPFSDGNGRLGRLLCNYSLSVITPFPTPVYNVWNESITCKEDYIDALVSARKQSNMHPEALTTMLIESNWLGWKEFFRQVEANGGNK